MGATRPVEAAPGTIRHDFGLTVGRNLTHASDSPENGEAEIALWFKPEELYPWSRSLDEWITGIINLAIGVRRILTIRGLYDIITCVGAWCSG